MIRSSHGDGTHEDAANCIPAPTARRQKKHHPPSKTQPRESKPHSTSRYTRQVWTETADAHEAATAVSACSPSRRKARADHPAPPVDSERAFPRRRPPAARPSPAPCYASWALPGTARALARPIAVRSRAEGLDTDAARLPTPLVDSEGPPSRSAARAEDRDLRPLHVPSRGELRTLLDTKRRSRKSLESMHETIVGFASSSPRSHILFQISPRSHSDLPESGNSYELLWSSTEVHMSPS